MSAWHPHAWHAHISRKGDYNSFCKLDHTLFVPIFICICLRLSELWASVDELLANSNRFFGIWSRNFDVQELLKSFHHRAKKACKLLFKFSEEGNILFIESSMEWFEFSSYYVHLSSFAYVFLVRKKATTVSHWRRMVTWSESPHSSLLCACEISTRSEYIKAFTFS